MFEGDFAIHLKCHFSRLIDGKKISSGGNNFELYFEYNDVDSFVVELKENNVQFVHELREQPWRQKVVRFYYLDRESMQHLSFRLSKAGKPVEEIAAITNMPVEFFNTSIAKYE